MADTVNESRSPQAEHEPARVRILFKGIVQGVGFRPFIYRCALQLDLTGFVKNTGRGVVVEVEGARAGEFLDLVLSDLPPLAKIETHETVDIPSCASKRFDILNSESEGLQDLLVSPDIALCEHCRREMLSPEDRRHLYPFINCTDCGPRHTIVRDLPYDRPKTSMAQFTMCPDCESEYTTPWDRRYHAQPISCFACGPRLRFIQKGGPLNGDPVQLAADVLRREQVVAVKGLGGYHLACLATSEEAVGRLRQMKMRDQKPFAMMGTPGMIAAFCYLTPREEEILRSPSAPILLLHKRPGGTIAPSVAPHATRLGFMIPYTPLHHLLLDRLGEPLVLTSANLSDDPIVYADDLEALEPLSDAILTHDRPIHTFADDSVAAVVSDNLYMIRRSRGFIPLPIDLAIESERRIVALGAMLKATFTLLFRDRAVLSQYIGNADSPGTIGAMRTLIGHYRKIYNFVPDLVAVDKHPDYPNRCLSEEFPECRLVEIQHHRAHIGALLAETGETGPLLGVSMDGTGYGDDGAIWGGEFFVGDHRGLDRFAHLRYQFLPSGEQAIKEPWRHALSYLYTIHGDSEPVGRFVDRFGERGERMMEVIEKGVSGINTSSCGRLFDAVACLLGLGDVSGFDGDLPARLQSAAEAGPRPRGVYGFKIHHGSPHRLDMVPAVAEMLDDGGTEGEKAYLFHATLAAGILDIARIARQERGIDKVGLSGGVFQNILLLTMTMERLENDGFKVLIHRDVPANDGGVSLGQAFLAAGMEDG